MLNRGCVKMKKILILVTLVISICLVPLNTYASSNDKIKVYFFRGSTCSHCESSLNYLNEHKKDIPENVEIITYEVWENENNAKLQ